MRVRCDDRDGNGNKPPSLNLINKEQWLRIHMHTEARVHVYLLLLQAYGEGADLTLKATIYHLATVKQDHRLDLKTFTLHTRNAEYNPKVGSTATFPRCKHMCYFIYLSILPLSSLQICDPHLFFRRGRWSSQVGRGTKSEDGSCLALPK